MFEKSVHFVPRMGQFRMNVNQACAQYGTCSKQSSPYHKHKEQQIFNSVLLRLYITKITNNDYCPIATNIRTWVSEIDVLAVETY